MRIDLATIRDHCLSKPGATECFPFDQETLVFKVGGKMFAAIDITLGESINLKCAPEYALELREKYFEVTPGYHMNKKHWNTVQLQGRLTIKQIFEWIDHSYELVFDSLPKKLQAEIKNRL